MNTQKVLTNFVSQCIFTGMAGKFWTFNAWAAATWPAARLILALAGCLLILLATGAGQLQHRAALDLAGMDRRQLQGRFDSLAGEMTRLRMEAQTFYDCGDLGYQKVHRLMLSRKFTTAFNSWARQNKEKERRNEWLKK